MQSGATPPPLLLLEILGLRGMTPYDVKKAGCGAYGSALLPAFYLLVSEALKAQSTLCVSLLNSKTKKKAPVIGFFHTFLCQTLKRICVSVV